MTAVKAITSKESVSLEPRAEEMRKILSRNKRQFATLCGLLSLNRAMQTNLARVENREALYSLIAERTSQRPRAELIADLEKLGVPGGPINTVAEAIDEPQIRARQLCIAQEGLPGLRTPIRLSHSLSGLSALRRFGQWQLGLLLHQGGRRSMTMQTQVASINSGRLAW